MRPAPIAHLRYARRRGSSTPSAIVTPGPNTTFGSIVTSRPISVSCEKYTVSGAISVTPAASPRGGGASADAPRPWPVGAVVDAEHLLDSASVATTSQALRVGDLDDVGEVDIRPWRSCCRPHRAASARAARQAPSCRRCRSRSPLLLGTVLFFADGDQPAAAFRSAGRSRSGWRPEAEHRRRPPPSASF